ncbi:insulinase family protein [Sphingobacterium sp. lm-10]|uniref:M16 family metallopeptidase n=1 Tax=Sphingobacterium sp. lm-10 TaxID=2944904 RepID=UPI00202162BE|nr:M16 family metallopeptidase [Sphingobacterium sp. lm-10]MCL7987331.1 insulinase family protein [Sphingobacterium sp. lm-10]
MKVISRETLFTLLFFLSVGAYAQQKEYAWAEAEDGGYSYRYVNNDPTESRFYKLSNGLTVILSANKKQPRIQAYIATKAGSKTDPQNHTGLAHYLEHMLFKGTDTFGSLDWSKEKPLLDQIDVLYEAYNSTTDEEERKSIYRRIDSVSGEAARFAIPNEYDKIMGNMGSEGTNAFTSFEQTVYVEDIPNNVVEKYLAVQAERFRAPVLRLFHTELETVYEEKNIGLDNDSRKTFEAMFEAMFPNNNYGRQTVIGTVEHLKNPSLNAIREYYSTYYVPNNMGIIMSGDFDPTEMVQKIDRAFSYMKPKDIPEYTFAPEPEITQPVSREVKGPSTEFVYLGFRFPGAATDDAQMLDLISNVLTNGAAGLIDLNLVKKQKLLGAAAFAYTLKDYSILMLQGNPSQGQSLEEVRDLLLAELKKLRDGNFSDDLITAIINNERKAEISLNESYKGRARELMEAFTSEVDWAKNVGYTDRLASLTKDDVVAFANKYLNNDNYVVVYKRQGTDDQVVKVQKPEITPIVLNRDSESAFSKNINALPEASIEPVWLDYEKDVTKGKQDDIEILAVENKDNALFNLSYQYAFGKWDNKLLPLALDYLKYLGTKDRDSESFSQAFYQLASNFSVSAGNEETRISISGLNDNFDETVSLIQDLLRNCIADEEAFDAYISRLKKSRSNAKENKQAIMEGLRAHAKFGAENPFNYTLSDAELDGLTAKDLVEILHDLPHTKHRALYYGPQLVSQLIPRLPALNNGGKPYVEVTKGTIFKELPTTENQVLFAHYDMKQAEVHWFRNSGEYDVANTPVISLFNNYFGAGMSSIVFQTIRESKALAYSTYAYFFEPQKKQNDYTVSAYIGTQSDKFAEAITGMNDLLDELPESETTLETAKASLLKSIASERITNAAILNSYIAAERLGNTSDVRKAIYERVPALGYQDLRNFHGEEFSKKPYVYCVVGDEEALAEHQLEEIGKVKKLSLKEIFGY